MLKWIVFFLIPLPAAAYTPGLEMILSFVEKNKGRGWYKISQTILFSDSSTMANPLEFKETWIKGPSSLFLRVRSPKNPSLSASFFYSRGFKTWRNSMNKKHSRKKRFIEPFFSLKSSLPAKSEDLKDVEVRLVRIQGAAAYFFELKKEQGLWVEQDEFVTRQIQFGPQKFLKALDWGVFARGLFFPKKRKWQSPQYTVHIKLDAVEPLKSKVKTALVKNNWTASSSEEDMEMVKEFYQNFR